MGWAFSYLKGISKENEKNVCKASKSGKKHKPEFWFGSVYCKRCNVELKMS